jgi:hypothetical protein
MEIDSKIGAEISRRLAATKNMHYHYQEYLAIGEDICASLPFKNYFTIQYGFWPKNVDEDSFKSRGNELENSEDKEQVEEHASSLEEQVHIEANQIATEDTSVSDGFDADGEGVLASNDETELSDGSKKRELDRLRDGHLAIKKEIQALKDTILHQVVELEVLAGKCAESAVDLDSISKQLDVLKGQLKKDIQEFQRIPLRVYIDRSCGIIGLQGHGGELVRYEGEGMISSRMSLQGQPETIRAVARRQQQVGLVYKYTWDPGISLLDCWTVISIGRRQEVPRVGVLQDSMGCNRHSIGLILVWDPGITVPEGFESILHRECYQFPRLTWDPGIRIGSVGSCLELPCNCLRTSNLGEGGFVMFPIFPLRGI